jgi:hypothetical protein
VKTNRALRGVLFRKLGSLYQRMEQSYNSCAQEMGLSCVECPDNCCTSYFQHHTYIEWAYLWKGIEALRQEERDIVLQKADEYVLEAKRLLSQGLRPRIMCPLNGEGLCQLYLHRLMICRLHGVPNVFRMPDGKERTFPGCFRGQEIGRNLEKMPMIDRTGFYRELAELEIGFGGSRLKQLPRVNMTLAEMLVAGPPSL